MQITPAQQVIELRFPLLGKVIPSHNGYPTFAAVCRAVPDAHSEPRLGIHTIQGRLVKPGFIRIDDFSLLRIRLPIEKITALYKLAGKLIDIGGCPTRCGIPTVHVLEPASQLRSRLVLIKFAGDAAKNRYEPEQFLNAVKRKLKSLEVCGDVFLEPSSSTEYGAPYARRVLRIKRATVPGYGVIVSSLSDEDSLKMQTIGIGGRRHMGCGIFDPISSVQSLGSEVS